MRLAMKCKQEERRASGSGHGWASRIRCIRMAQLRVRHSERCQDRGQMGVHILGRSKNKKVDSMVISRMPRCDYQSNVVAQQWCRKKEIEDE